VRTSSPSPASLRPSDGDRTRLWSHPGRVLRPPVGVVGIGGLGHLGIQYAKIAGAFTVAIDVDEDKLDLVKQLGADHVLNAATHDVVAEMQKVGGADAIVSTAATPKPLQAAFASLRPMGRLVLVGLPDNVFPLPIFETVLRGVQVIGSLVGTREEEQLEGPVHDVQADRAQRRVVEPVGDRGEDLEPE
jgi:alcohol dehydrogenase, propanol-preferring